jgi:hypothetical protein
MAAHRLTGRAGQFGFWLVSRIGRQFESAAEAGAAETGALADELAQAIDTTIGVIRQEFADATGHQASDAVSL